MTVSKNTIKLITSLQQKKYRQKYNLFVAEGVKVVQELLQSSLELKELYSTDASLVFDNNPSTMVISEKELKKISFLKSPNKVLALFHIPESQKSNFSEFTLVLDGINDPGNLGTIIRLCDWFGISQLVCSKNTVDCYNPKVVQSTMGSITRVSIVYSDLIPFLTSSTLPIYGAAMRGENVYNTTLEEKAILVMGNEANGISASINDLIQQNITIPRFGSVQETESLNVATATSILLSEFKRRLK